MSNDEGDLEDAARLRPNLRPIALALVANLLFGSVLIGLPYLRGQRRAEESLGAFAHFAACIFGGEVAPQPGLALPRGERARFATLALTDRAWPARCRDALARTVHEPAILVFPSVKGAENAVREAALRVDRALTALERGRDTGRVPEAPLVALARLQAALVEQARVTGIDATPTRDAIVLGDARDLPTPSILPMRVGEGGPLEVALEGGVLLATASDDRLIGHLRVEPEGSVDVRLARRRLLVSAVIGAREPPWVVWSTSQAQCRNDPSGCARRATGIAPFVEDGQRLAPQAWLRAHPIASPREAVHVGRGAVWIAARGDAGRLHLRRFVLPDARGEEGDGPAEVAASFELALDATDPSVRFLDGDPPALVVASAEGAVLVRAEEGAEPVELESPGSRVVVASCGDADDGWVALASQRGVRVARTGSEIVSIDVDGAISPPEPGAIALACDEEGADVLMLREGELSRAVCGSEGCAPPERIVAGVDRFDAVRFGGALLVAFSSGGPNGPVRVARVQGGSVAVGVPSPCWEPADGLCGAPRLAADDARVVLVARDGGDLRVLASEDGQTWHALVGLEQP